MCILGALRTQIAIKKTHQLSFYLLTLMVFSIFSSGKATAQGNLLITPRRVVFKGNKRIQELNLANMGKDTATYHISFTQIRMREDGSFEKITQPDPGQNFASDYLRFFPRQITLAPNEAQLVKMQIIKTHLLQPGEYRSHIYFRGMPNKKPLGEEDRGDDATGVSVSLVPIFGISIPVIIRRGESTAEVSLSELKLEMGEDLIPTVNLRLNRTGNMSVYGDIQVDYVSPEGRVSRVGLVKGLAVYTPTSSRFFSIKLDDKDEIDYTRGKLHLVYSRQKADKGGVLSEAELHLQ